ncbi:MAG TPA: peroxidase-related enzyme [Phototrophicaceae bacterium]|nr:peroxidase-related enzyme [Phototrophicaceae bacterium]
MAYIKTIPEAESQGKLHDLFEGDRKTFGYVPNHLQLFSERPEVNEAWRALQTTIRKNMRLRTYELVTMAAAKALHCRYCLLAHGAVLLKNGFTVDQLRAMLTDFGSAGLEPSEVAMMEFAFKVASDAYQMTQADTDALRAHGFSDAEILDITLSATARSFFSQTLEALGAQPDAAYDQLAAQLGDLLPEMPQS